MLYVGLGMGLGSMGQVQSMVLLIGNQKRMKQIFCFQTLKNCFGWWNKFPYTHIPYLSRQLIAEGLTFGGQVRCKVRSLLLLIWLHNFPHSCMIDTWLALRYAVMFCVIGCVIDRQVSGSLPKSFPAKSFRVLLACECQLARVFQPAGCLIEVILDQIGINCHRNSLR